MKNLILTIAIVMIVGGAVFLYLQHEPAQDELLLTGTLMTDAAGGGISGDQLAILKTLQSLAIDTSLFKLKVWESFLDSSHEIEDQPITRPNPFAPIEVSVAPVGTTTTSQ